MICCKDFTYLYYIIKFEYLFIYRESDIFLICRLAIVLQAAYLHEKSPKAIHSPWGFLYVFVIYPQWKNLLTSFSISSWLFSMFLRIVLSWYALS